MMSPRFTAFSLARFCRDFQLRKFDFPQAIIPALPITCYLLSTSTTKLSGRIGGRGRGLSVVGAGLAPNFAVTV